MKKVINFVNMNRESFIEYVADIFGNIRFKNRIIKNFN